VHELIADENVQALPSIPVDELLRGAVEITGTSVLFLMRSLFLTTFITIFPLA